MDYGGDENFEAKGLSLFVLARIGNGWPELPAALQPHVSLILALDQRRHGAIIL